MPRIAKITLGRQLKVGLPNYSSNLLSTFIDWEVKEGETFDFDQAWEIVNAQIESQAGNKIDPNLAKPKFPTPQAGWTPVGAVVKGVVKPDVPEDLPF